ncbi:hypothetical protein KBD20_03370 [Candidatus Saccharibacteria bacterium]|nr:hypothetical protein [Candidatus Saccharibacteria bacterium]
MSENVQVQKAESTVQQSEQYLDMLALNHPDVIELKDPEVQRCTELLIAEFGIKSEFFTDNEGDARGLLLASIAANLAAFESSGMDARTNPVEYEYIADLVMVIALNYVTGFDELVHEANADMHGEVTESQKASAIEKFKSVELSNALREAVKDRGLLNAPKEMMGITDLNEDDYELVVLSMSSNDDDVHHYQPELDWPSIEDYNIDRVAAKAKDRAATELGESAKTWRQGLLSRREAFAVESGYPFVGSAFADTLDGKKYLCVTADVAERIIDRDTTMLRDSDYNNSAYEHDLAYLQHEYTHTQGGVFQTETYTGIALEELRAEHFSGNRQGYVDVKIFSQDIELVTGLNLRELLEGKVKGGSQSEVYSEIAAEVGLHNLIKILSILPTNYYEGSSNKFQKRSMDFLGGNDGVIRGLFDEYTALYGEDTLKGFGDRITKKLSGSDDPAFILNYRRRFSQFGTQLLEKEFAI